MTASDLPALNIAELRDLLHHADRRVIQRRVTQHQERRGAAACAQHLGVGGGAGVVPVGHRALIAGGSQIRGAVPLRITHFDDVH